VLYISGEDIAVLGAQLAKKPDGKKSNQASASQASPSQQGTCIIYYYHVLLYL